MRYCSLYGVGTKNITVEIAQLWQHNPRQLHYSNNFSKKMDTSIRYFEYFVFKPTTKKKKAPLHLCSNPPLLKRKRTLASPLFLFVFLPFLFFLFWQGEYSVLEVRWLCMYRKCKYVVIMLERRSVFFFWGAVPTLLLCNIFT